MSAAPQLSSVSIGSLVRAVSQEKPTETLLLKIPYKFKKSYWNTVVLRNPRPPQGAPWLHGPSLKSHFIVVITNIGINVKPKSVRFGYDEAMRR